MSDGINITLDIKEVEKYLQEIGKERHLNFIVSKAVNSVLKQIQDAIRKELAAKLNLRRVSWNLLQIKINKEDWANKTKLFGRIHITDEAHNLVRLATGNEHYPYKGGRYLAIPNKSVFGNRVITKDNPFNPSNLQLQRTPRGLQGNQGTFLVETQRGTPLILQRTQKQGSKRKGKKGTDRSTGVRMLYTLVKKSKTPLKINWEAIIYTVVNKTFQAELIKAIQYAFDTAKAK